MLLQQGDSRVGHSTMRIRAFAMGQEHKGIYII